ncbi:glycoside hydrolase family 66 protein [Cerasicoccus arenae]|nr:glycoside hydrolase family 66 protein [Cerasicoccus arenae]MBK1858039.1 hypothetical protein [Cerasicoccus arenae]
MLPRLIIAVAVFLFAKAPAFSEQLSISDPQLEAALRKSGPPLRDGSGVLFRFEPPSNLEIKAVYLAGSFNNWANNDNGVVNNPRFAMQNKQSDVWYKFIDTPTPDFQYRYVMQTTDGQMLWTTDPFIDARQGDNSATNLNELQHLRAETVTNQNTQSPTMQLSLQRVWVEPSEANLLYANVTTPDNSLDLRIHITTPLGRVIYNGTQAARNGVNQIKIPAIEWAGGYITQVELVRDDQILAEEHVILSITKNPADDLRYGFFASYPNTSENYDAKAAMLADLYINAVEFYDYFPAHGDYAPSEAQYVFEPFGVAINGLDVKAKIEACQRRGILALAYISAYAASESVYREITDPMTDAQGRHKIFNGEIMAEEDADDRGKPKWFWLMNVSEGSAWRSYIMEELKRTLEDNPDDLVAFDGFEIDTYGDPTDARFYANGSPHDGKALADILQGFVSHVAAMTHETKPHGLVSFNSVNEFGVQNMYDVTDFLFLEIWRWQAARLSDLVDISYFHQGASNQRVILKLYPADMAEPQSSWPKWTLARILGATMTGGGSLMVVGEPDESTETMHALNSLYYPDHQPLTKTNADVLKRYYAHDAMLYEYTHGGNVSNLDLRVPLDDGITRSYYAPHRNAICVQLLNLSGHPDWSDAPSSISTRRNVAVNIPLPESITPQAIYFASPDSDAYQFPTQLDFDTQSDQVSISIPELIVHGTIIITCN